MAWYTSDVLQFNSLAISFTFRRDIDLPTARVLLIDPGLSPRPAQLASPAPLLLDLLPAVLHSGFRGAVGHLPDEVKARRPLRRRDGLALGIDQLRQLFAAVADLAGASHQPRQCFSARLLPWTW